MFPVVLLLAQCRLIQSTSLSLMRCRNRICRHAVRRIPFQQCRSRRNRQTATTSPLIRCGKHQRSWPQTAETPLNLHPHSHQTKRGGSLLAVKPRAKPLTGKAKHLVCVNRRTNPATGAHIRTIKPNRRSPPHKKANLSPITAPKIEISSQQKVRRSVSPHRDLSDSHSFAYSTFGHAKRGNINTNRNIAAKHIQQQTVRRARLSCRAKEVSASAAKTKTVKPMP